MKRLYLSDTDKKIAGVCGGIAEIYDLDPTVVRLTTVLVTILTGFVPLAVVYIVAWIVMPKKTG